MFLFNDMFLLQPFYDIITEHFIEGKLSRNTYLKISNYIETNRELFTVNLN